MVAVNGRWLLFAINLDLILLIFTGFFDQAPFGHSKIHILV